MRLLLTKQTVFAARFDSVLFGFAAVIMATRSIAVTPPPEIVVFDRPFAIAIEDAESGAPLFLGVVAAPQFD